MPSLSEGCAGEGDEQALMRMMQLLNDNAKFAWKPEWESLLANGTVNNPARNNLTGIIYGTHL